MIDLATSEEETKASIQDTNLVASPPKEKEAYKTQCRPTCGKISKELQEGVVGRKLEDDKKIAKNCATLKL